MLTNGATEATVHRVAHVPWRRLSLVRFVGFESDAIVAPLPGTGSPRYAAVAQGAHVDARVDEAERNRAASAARGVIPEPASV